MKEENIQPSFALSKCEPATGHSENPTTWEWSPLPVVSASDWEHILTAVV